MNEKKITFWLQPESRRLEFKEAWPKGDQIARTTVAFANGAGGRIVFGVKDEPREIIGVPDSDIFTLKSGGKREGTFVRIGSVNRKASDETLVAAEVS